MTITYLDCCTSYGIIRNFYKFLMGRLDTKAFGLKMSYYLRILGLQERT